MGRLLNTTQRKYLEKRVHSHAEKVLPRRWRNYGEEKPKEVVEAEATIKAWEESLEKKYQGIESRLDREVKRVVEGLMFDTQEDAVRQVNEFEELDIEYFKE